MSKKWYDYTCNNTLARTRNVIDNVRVNNTFFLEILFNLKAIKFHLLLSIENNMVKTSYHKF